MGRTAKGVRGIRLEADQSVIALLVVPDADVPFVGDNEPGILTSTEHGYGKRTPVSDFPRKNRGGKGVIAIKTSTRNGAVVNALNVVESDEVMLITDGGVLIRTRVSEISSQGRNTQGVRLISLKGEERLVTVSKVEDASDSSVDGQENSDDLQSDSEAPANPTLH